ncbi:MAG: 50S ribosomal protein L30 [Candidatus Brocadiia bacterium]
MVKPIEVSLIKSPIGRPEKHRKILRSLGLTRMHRPVSLYSSPQVLGALRKVIHMVSVRSQTPDGALTGPDSQS